MPVSTTAASTNVRGSVALVSYNSERSHRVVANAAAAPSSTPAIARRSPSPMHQCEHVATLRAERHADPDLAAALRHEVGDHAINAEGGEQDRGQRERAE